jgi:L-ribulose-5-phosphate 4-epimerase
VSAIADLRRTVAELHGELTRSGLVAWTSGNISARVPGRDLIVIKPSGVSYDELTAESMVVVDLHGTVVEGELSPSSDTATHAYVYRAMAAVGGVVHTHSPYATAWAAQGTAIPCVLTAMADEFGGDIPVGRFARIGGEEIGVAIVDALADSRSPAVLMRNHGVYTIGAGPREAVKAAVMCEDVARTVLLASSLGAPERLAQADIDALYDRYQNVYGQRPVDATPTEGVHECAPWRWANTRSGSSPAARRCMARRSSPRSAPTRARSQRRSIWRRSYPCE